MIEEIVCIYTVMAWIEFGMIVTLELGFCGSLPILEKFPEYINEIGPFSAYTTPFSLEKLGFIPSFPLFLGKNKSSVVNLNL